MKMGKQRIYIFNPSLLIKSNNSFIELKNTVLPPQYMDLFEKTTDNFQEIENKCTYVII
jgi:hypothetical protein